MTKRKRAPTEADLANERMAMRGAVELRELKDEKFSRTLARIRSAPIAELPGGIVDARPKRMRTP